MALFNDVFNKSGVYGMLFFNIKAVLIHPTLEDLKTKNPKMYERWKYLSKVKYAFDLDVIHAIAGTMTDETAIYGQKIYEENAVNHPEFTKIVAITYGTLYNESGEVKRYLKKIVNDNECIVIDDFMDLLSVLSSEGAKSSPPRFHILCGHNIIAHDIPLLIKRFMHNRKNLKSNKELPFILKKALDTKPWESGIIDTVNVWKFNGFEYSPLMLVADFLELKKTDDLVTHNDLSKYYWTNISEKPVETLEYVARQSAIQTNLVIQLMLEMRLV